MLKTHLFHESFSPVSVGSFTTACYRAGLTARQLFVLVFLYIFIFWSRAVY